MKHFVLVLLVFAASLSPVAAQSTLFIVRHAEKASGGGDNPDLSEPGRARAEALVKVLRDAAITAIYTTEFKRTQETAAPTAKVLGIEATIVPGKDLPGLIAKLHDLNGNALVVGHGNTIPDLIKALGIDTPINIGENDYDNLFIAVLEDKPRLIHLHYR